MVSYVGYWHGILRGKIREGDSSCPEEIIYYYTQLVFTTGVNTTMENVHDAWAIWTVQSRPEHGDLIPYADTPDEVKEWDRHYRDAIVWVAEMKNRVEHSV